MIDPKWFVRKLGSCLRAEEEFPTNLVNWAMDQIDSVPDAVGIRTIRSDSKPEIVAWPSTLTWSLKDRIDRLVEFCSKRDPFDANFEKNHAGHSSHRVPIWSHRLIRYL